MCLNLKIKNYPKASHDKMGSLLILNMAIVIQTPAIISTDRKLIPVDLYDIITIQTINERKIQIQKEKRYKIPTNDENPIYKVATALQKLRPNKFGAKISIQKNIPTFSGLNSQKSNAAGVLIALNKLWKFDLSKEILYKIAKQIDLKMAKILNLFFKQTPAKKNIILIRPKHIVINEKWIGTRNAFRYFPDLKEIVKTLEKRGAYKSGLSRKGPICFGFFENPINPNDFKKILKRKTDFIWAGKTCNKAVKSDKLKV